MIKKEDKVNGDYSYWVEVFKRILVFFFVNWFILEFDEIYNSNKVKFLELELYKGNLSLNIGNY